MIGLGLWSFLFWAIFQIVPLTEAGSSDPEAVRASTLMARAIAALREHRDAFGPPIDARFDLNRTGLIGLEESSITTSLGRLEAKRTTTNPLFAGAVVRMFREAGVKRGDVAAIGASSSFPGLILATLSAAEAMGLKPLLLSSLGASNWGGNNPDWTWLEISDCLRRAGVLDVHPIALSIGGEGDVGQDMSEDGRELLWLKILKTGRPFLQESDLIKNVQARVAALDKNAGRAAIKVFVNVGGSWADMGTDGEVLKLRPGFNPASAVFIPPPARRGLIQEMARRGVPVIHLLFVKGLGDRYGLPWDPVPLPDPEKATFSAQARPLTGSGTPKLLGIIVLGIYLAGMILGLGWIIRKNRQFGI